MSYGFSAIGLFPLRQRGGNLAAREQGAHQRLMRTGALGSQVGGPQRGFEGPLDQCAIANVADVVLGDGQQGQRGKGGGVSRIGRRDVIETGTHALARGGVVASPQFDRLNQALMTHIAFAGGGLVELTCENDAVGLGHRRDDPAHNAFDGRPVIGNADVLEAPRPDDRAGAGVVQPEGQGGGFVPRRVQAGTDAILAARRIMRR